MNFYQFYKLLEQQLSLFPAQNRELYHGSNTGADFSMLYSFQSKGIIPDLAKGYGQGAGFYVWSDKQSAINHTTQITDGIESQAKRDGLPMVITIETLLDTENWDLDYEANRNVIINWLHLNWDSVKNNLGNILDINNSKKISSNYGKAIKFAITNSPGGGNLNRSIYSTSNSDSDKGTGEILGTVVNQLQKNNPQVTKPFESQFFANLNPGVAIKYVGSQVLKPKK